MDVDSKTYLVIYTVAAIFGNFGTGGLLMIHSYLYIKKKIRKTNTKKSSITYKSMLLFTIITIIFFTLCIVIATVAKYTCNENWDKSTSALYQLSKCCMYLVFIMRLHFVYKNSTYAYNIKLLQIWSIFIIVVYLGLCIYGVSSTVHTEDKDTILLFGSIIYFCHKNYAQFYLILSLSMDMINSIATSIAFILPLIKILKRLKQTYSDNKHKDEELKQPVIKISILTLIIIITSIMAHIVGLLSQDDTVFLIDIPFNCLCIMLMTSYYNTWYNILCCGIIKCVALFDIENQTKMEEIIVNDKMQEAKSNQYDDTKYDTRTGGTILVEIENHNQSECTQTTDLFSI